MAKLLEERTALIPMIDVILHTKQQKKRCKSIISYDKSITGIWDKKVGKSTIRTEKKITLFQSLQLHLLRFSHSEAFQIFLLVK